MFKSAKKYINKKYNKLTILSIIGEDIGITNTKVLCLCECGNKKIITLRTILRGRSKSCGCLQKEQSSKSRKNRAIHNNSHTRLYRIYYSMIDRCYNKANTSYEDYGKRGVTVCDSWLNDFKAFQEWAYKVGYNDNLTIDRIDVNGNYKPSNCRFATRTEQNNNKRNNIKIEYNGRELTLSQWAKELNLPYRKLYNKFIKFNRDGIKTLSYFEQD